MGLYGGVDPTGKQDQTMTSHDTVRDSDDDHAGEQRDVRITFDDGGCVIYDRENPAAWIQAIGDESVIEIRN